MKFIHKLLAAVTTIVFILGFLPAQPVHAAVFVVTNTDNDGPGSLRQAVIDACDLDACNDIITFDPDLAGETILLTSQIDIDKNLTIDGKGLDPHIKISGGDAVRVFNVTGSWINNFYHLDIINGYEDDGGGIHNSESALTIIDCNFSNNSATNGGALYNGGNLTIKRSVFSENAASIGGAIYHFHYTLDITNTRFNGNAALTWGGAIFSNSTIGQTSIKGSLFSDNRAGELINGEGGAIYNNGTVDLITKTTFSGNYSDKDGGGIYNTGTITSLERSTFSTNTADNNGGGILNGSAGGDLLVVNSTFSGNNASGKGGGVMSEGLLTVTNATFSRNGASFGGGIAAAVSATQKFHLTNTILANSTTGGDCYNLLGNTLNTNTNNLIEVNGPAGHLCGTPAVTDDPQLDPLANNGFKKAQTHALAITSPALDAGSDPDCPEKDQRGRLRPADGDANGSFICDIGAFERQHTLKVKRYRSQAAYDGWLLEASEKSSIGGKMNDFDFNVKVGDDSENRQFRSILSFNTAKLPDSAVVTRANMKVKRVGVIGANPFGTSDLVADIRKGPFSNNIALQLTDFQATSSMQVAGTFNSTLLKGNKYKVKLVPEAFIYVHKKGVTQLRLRFTKDDNNNFSTDYIMFYSGDVTQMLRRPVLIVQYYVP
jgi:predicted outer membrane repeat protein